MSIITFTSDFGTTDHYVAAVKAKLYSLDADVQIVDISHSIEAFNIAQGSFVIKSVYRDFPVGTVHLVAVDAQSPNQKYIAVSLEGHYFVGADNGLLSLLSEQGPEEIIVLDTKDTTTFTTKEILAPATVALSQGVAIQKLGSLVSELERRLPRMLKATRKQIVGHVVHVDHYGNLITNIDQNTFEHLRKEASFQIRFGRETANHLQQHYHEVEYGEVFLLFNSAGWLEIGINQGNAHELLGLSYDSPIMIQFERDSG
ncbi:SAM hydrolase/SAM-dependent halogenase family protein [Tunicatimonas pelagia]|uniref:SAM hydrolase/SAM-dependent halogenase family protein n=1 Tax=Tunicatimonas pelagia TaxID=931531 RepID=UPI002666496C|nr:SAM-dependent chlorinase/fluorinase [Tunicatimonas pelagia]WKN44021.1 SAM-dependent chlorinase/fluorinase [Tunicatimonas pelagia]